MAHSPQFLKRRKFLLVFPLLALPFVTLAFWALGGGAAAGTVAGQAEKTGININLPGARNDSEAHDKMSMYAKSDKDSLEFHEQLRMDPYARKEDAVSAGSESFGFGNDPAYSGARGIGGYQYQSFSDPNEARIQRKLSELEASLQEPETEYLEEPTAAADNGQQRRLEALLQAAGGDQEQEMAQINAMLEKLIDVQNPERVAEKLREQSARNRGRVLPVSRYAEPQTVSMLASPARDYYPDTTLQAGGGFYDLDSDLPGSDTLPQTGIPAVVHETQTLVSGAAIKMRLTADVYVSGELVPAGTFLSGTCSVDGERLKVEIQAIRTGKNIYPVSMLAYDLDAIEGIRIPGAISRDAAKEGTDRTLQSLQLMSLNPSLGAQAAGAGVEVAKGFLGKKAKLVRVTVKAGHPLLLVDAKTKQGS